MFQGNQSIMASPLSVDAQEFVPVVNGHSKLCSSLSVDAPAFVPIVAPTKVIIPEDNHEERLSIDPQRNASQEGKSSIQRRGRFAQVDTRNQQKHKSTDIFSNPQIINKKGKNRLAQQTSLGSSDCEIKKMNESSEKVKLQQTFSLAEYSSKQQRSTTEDQEKFNSENNDKKKNTNFHTGESKPIVLWSAVVKKEPNSEEAKLESTEISDIASNKKYSKTKVARRKNVNAVGVLSEAPNDRYKLFNNSKKEEDWKEEDMLDIVQHTTCNPNEHKKSEKKLLNKAPGTIPQLHIQDGKKTKGRSGSKLKNTEFGNKQGLPTVSYDGKLEDENNTNSGKKDFELTTTDVRQMNKSKKSLEKNDDCKCTKVNNTGKKKKSLQIGAREEKHVLDTKPIPIKSSEKPNPNIEMGKESVAFNISDSNFPQLSLGSLPSCSKQPLSYSAVTKRAPAINPNVPHKSSSGSTNISNVDSNISEEEKRMLKKRQKALKRKQKVKQKKEEAKLNKSMQGTSEKLEKVTDKEITFDLSDMFTKLLNKNVEKAERKTGKGRNVKMSTGVISVMSGLAKKNSPDGRKVERNKYGSTHTIMDGTTIRKRGKERETPKKKRPTLLKKVITAERKRKRALLKEKTLVVDITVSEEQTDNHLKPEPDSVGKITKYPENIWKKIHSKKFREYCDQVITKEINHLTYNLLLTLQKFQDRVYHENPIKYKQKRRFILGLREVLKHLKLKRMKAVIIAPNIERISAEGGLDDYLGSIISICNEQDIPKIFAMNRHILGRVIKKSAPVSVVGIFDYDGAHEIFKELLTLVQSAKITYTEKVNALYKEEHVTKMVSGGSQLTSISSDPLVNDDQHAVSDIKQNLLDKLYVDKSYYDTAGSESDAWVTDNENAL